MGMVTPGKGVNMQFRVPNSNGSVQLAQLPGTAPVWVRLTVSGQQYNGDFSTDGVTWTRLGSVQFGADMTQIGLALTSHHPSATATAVFEGVDVQP
jgi:hypothetical protein